MNNTADSVYRFARTALTPPQGEGEPAAASARRGLDPFRAAHTGLLLTRCADLRVLDKREAGAKPALIDRAIAACARAAPLYAAAFAERERMLRAFGAAAAVFALDCAGAVATGLGYPMALGQGVALHHLYGTPLIAGSGIKGMLHAYLRALPAAQFRPLFQGEAAAPQLDDEQCRNLILELAFGDTGEAGFVDVADAWVDPRNVERCDGKAGAGIPAALQHDVVTPHHGEYLRGSQAFPTDWDQPVPVPFISSAGRFHFALLWRGGDTEFDRALFAALCEWLADALCGTAERAAAGVGARTASGYGYFLRGEATP